jgi:polyprenyl P-hydroxybenzoate/phenylacrylic acid decarboxylase-like protein
MRLVVAITGASGSCYAEEFLRQLVRPSPKRQGAAPEINLIFSLHSAPVVAHELGWQVSLCRAAPPGAAESRRAGASALGRSLLLPQDLRVAVQGWPPAFAKACRLWHPHDLTAPFASGSNAPDAMVILPCTIGTAGRIAAGLGSDLITRAAAVCLKERRRLVLVVRESPLSLIDLRNLTRLAEAGAIIMPAAPGFYGKPKDLGQLVRHFVGRVCEQAGIPGDTSGRWRRGD